MNEQNDQKFLPWMPFVFGFILILALIGGYFLFDMKEKTPATEKKVQQGNPEEVIQPVRALLEDFKAGKVKEGYNKASSDFKIAMPYDAFQEFVSQYSALKNWTGVSFSDPQVEKSVASIVAYLHLQDDDGAMPVSFTLVREENRWKVYGFVLNSSDTEIPIKEIESLKDLIHTINEELAYLKKENTMAAYYKLTSRNFQKTTSYETFQTFIHDNPIFVEQEGASFSDGKIEGDSGHLKVSLFNEDDSIPIDYHLVKEEGKWKIDRAETLLSSNLQKPINQLEIDQMMEVVNIFLQTIKEDSLEKAYNVFTANSFKESTSETVFNTFIQDHPNLKQDASPQFIDGGREGGVHILYLLYGKVPYQSAFEIKLIKEAGGWKILGISLEAPQEDTYSTSLDKEQAVDLVQSVLSVLGSHQFEKYYRDFASKGFVRSVSYDDFITFLDDHPVLKNNPKPFIEEMMQDRDQLFLETELIDQTHSYSALFAFVFENKQWKVLRMEVKAEKSLSTEANSTKVSLSNILTGQHIDSLGLVQDSKETLQKPNDPIYLNIFLISPSPDSQVEMQLFHQESNTRTLPVSGKVDSEGNNILTFTFFAPEEGWPKGHYVAEAKSVNQILASPFEIDYPDSALEEGKEKAPAQQNEVEKEPVQETENQPVQKETEQKVDE